MGEKRITVYASWESSFIEECPFCGSKSMRVREVEYDLPEIGKVLLVSYKCEKCGYRKSDLVPLARRGRVRAYLRVSCRNDLYAKVVRSGAASVEIVELGAIIEPGIEAPTFITNVEGLLARFKEAIERIEVLEGISASKAKEVVEKLAKGDMPFTLIIDDPWGVSMIIHPRGEGKVVLEVVEGEEIGKA